LRKPYLWRRPVFLCHFHEGEEKNEPLPAAERKTVSETKGGNEEPEQLIYLIVQPGKGNNSVVMITGKPVSHSPGLKEGR